MFAPNTSNRKACLVKEKTAFKLSPSLLLRYSKKESKDLGRCGEKKNRKVLFQDKELVLSRISFMFITTITFFFHSNKQLVTKTMFLILFLHLLCGIIASTKN